MKGVQATFAAEKVFLTPVGGAVRTPRVNIHPADGIAHWFLLMLVLVVLARFFHVGT
ncbi:MAG: hypothetical protein P8Y63_13255 [Deltaproteobacteria bacterium]